MGEPKTEERFRSFFEFSPISLWEEDFGGINRLFDGLRRQGILSLEDYLERHPDFVGQCIGEIRVLDINQKTLSLFGAATKAELLANQDKIFREGMRHHWRDELLALWNGELAWSGEGINYTLAGEPLEILLDWRILPGAERDWGQVLVSIEDITARKRAEWRLRALFESSPISLWEEDYSGVKAYFDKLRDEGVTELRSHFNAHPQDVVRCMGLIKVLDVNQQTLNLFGAKSKDELISNLSQIFRGEMSAHFANELIDLWNGKLMYEREGINYSLSGEPVNIHLDFRVMPGHEEDFGWVLVAIQDISARKKAEEYLRYLGTHDVMTGLYNRAFFQESLLQLERDRREPVSVIVADLNGLKITNDSLGHQAGDALIRRAAEVLKANYEGSHVAARIGGDEFSVLLAGLDRQAADETVARLNELIAMNNKYYREPLLSISIGIATSRPGIALEKVISEADDAMYRSKSEHHKRRSTDR